MARPIAVVDYHKGNLSSVERGLVDAGGEVLVTDDPALIRDASGVVLPGVGSFGDAMEFLRGSGEADAVLDALARGVPFLGICLGLQLLFERGNETADGSWADGLGVLSGSATRLESTRLKVPHVGWDQVHLTHSGSGHPLLQGFAEGTNVYFTHSYAVDTDIDPSDAVALTHYARNFASIVCRGNLYGCQFHPEKSSAHGHQILENFVELARLSKGLE